MEPGWPESRTYVIWSSVNWIIFLAAVLFLSWGREAGLPVILVWAIILGLGATVVGQFVAAYRLIAEQDEFIRGITAKRGIAAGGVTLATAVLWGLAAQFAGAPHAPMWVLYPLFWGSFGLVTPFIRSSHA